MTLGRNIQNGDLVKKGGLNIVQYYMLPPFQNKSYVFGHNLRYETKDTFGEISLKLCQTNWNVARNNVNVFDDELPSQSTNNLHLFNN
jgi:hypothetical protein